MSLHHPIVFLILIDFSLLIGLIFLCYFGIRFSGESKRRSEAVNKLQQVIAKEYELESLGGQAAAAAHSLGTPLATISVVASELKKEMGQNENYKKDIAKKLFLNLQMFDFTHDIEIVLISKNKASSPLFSGGN